MKHLLSICFVFLVLDSNGFSQTDSSKLNLRDDTTILVGSIGNCYFEDNKYRKDGGIQKVIRHNGSGLTMVINYNRNGKVIRTRTKKGPVMNQAPPCYHDK